MDSQTLKEQFKRIPIQNVLLTQSLYYFITGVWPILNSRSFFFITGQKTDTWLVMTVGALVACIGVSLFVSAFSRRIFLETIILSAGVAISLFFIDVIYTALGRIAPIYLLDAAVELALAVLVIGTYMAKRGLGDVKDQPVRDETVSQAEGRL